MKEATPEDAPDLLASGERVPRAFEGSPIVAGRDAPVVHVHVRRIAQGGSYETDHLAFQSGDLLLLLLDHRELVQDSLYLAKVVILQHVLGQGASVQSLAALGMGAFDLV